MEKRIIVIDNEPLLADLIKEMLNEEEGFKVSQITATREDFLREIGENQFDIALVDISIGEREEGIDILRILRKLEIQLPAIAMSAHKEIDYGLKCLRAGAKGYLNKSEIVSSLTHALEEVCCGNLFVSGDAGNYILNQYKECSLGDERR
jgi:two-component system invasion response regulator UvrY